MKKFVSIIVILGLVLSTVITIIFSFLGTTDGVQDQTNQENINTISSGATN